jgi:hypothetical protein
MRRQRLMGGGEREEGNTQRAIIPILETAFSPLQRDSVDRISSGLNSTTTGHVQIVCDRHNDVSQAVDVDGPDVHHRTKHVHFIDPPPSGKRDSSAIVEDVLYPAKKHRKFERRNSKTAAMLLQAMSVVAATCDEDEDDGDQFVPLAPPIYLPSLLSASCLGPSPSSSPPHRLLPRPNVPMNSMTSNSDDDEFLNLYRSGVDIAETILSKMRMRHEQHQHQQQQRKHLNL